MGDLGAALVDDQLDPALRELVLRHMIGCVMCRHDVEEQRQLKARVQALHEPGLPFSLFSKLSALDKPSPLAPAPIPLPVLEPEPELAPAQPQVASGRLLTQSSFLHDAHRGRRLLAGAASLLLVGVATAYASAADGQSSGPAQPTANVFTTSTASEVTPSVPLNDPSFAAMTVSFGH